MTHVVPNTKPSTTGLEGIVVAETNLSLVDGQAGRLIYRGYGASWLAMHKTFEEVAHLLWTGRLPSESELDVLRGKFRQYRELQPQVLDVISALPNSFDMMSTLRTALSAVAPVAEETNVETAIQLTAMVPTIIAARQSFLENRPIVEPHRELNHTANYLYMLRGGTVPSDKDVKALEAYLVITMEHGMNASTFTGRVIASTKADSVSAVVGAVGAMKGPLHGGAPSEVMTMLEDIGEIERAEAFIRGALLGGERLMGFGHRVYKTTDPRAQALRGVVEQLAGDDPWFALSVAVEDLAVRLLEEYKPGRKLYANVEYWAAAILRTAGVAKHLYTPTFCCSRMVGWTAHIMEQAENNRLIRPQSDYIGPVYNEV